MRTLVRSLANLGYTVDTSRADAYFPTFSLRAGAPSRGIDLGDDVANEPLFSVDARGRTRRLRWSAGGSRGGGRLRILRDPRRPARGRTGTGATPWRSPPSSART